MKTCRGLDDLGRVHCTSRGERRPRRLGKGAHLTKLLEKKSAASLQGVTCFPGIKLHLTAALKRTVKTIAGAHFSSHYQGYPGYRRLAEEQNKSIKRTRNCIQVSDFSLVMRYFPFITGHAEYTQLWTD